MPALIVRVLVIAIHRQPHTAVDDERVLELIQAVLEGRVPPLSLPQIELTLGLSRRTLVYRIGFLEKALWLPLSIKPIVRNVRESGLKRNVLRCGRSHSHCISKELFPVQHVQI